MSEVQRLVDEFERAMCGDAWHGDSVVTILQRIPFARADAKTSSKTHSIREIVRHMAAWTNEVRRRMNGVPAGTPKEGDWPKASAKGPAAWADEIDTLIAAHNALVQDLQKFTDDDLNAPTRDPRNRATGAGVTRYVLLHGLVQHHAYHAGQISLLARM